MAGTLILVKMKLTKVERANIMTMSLRTPSSITEVVMALKIENQSE
jgi:hypothetical protein